VAGCGKIESAIRKKFQAEAVVKIGELVRSSNQRRAKIGISEGRNMNM